MSVNKALDWLEAAELPTGGIACWQDQNGHFLKAYPEVTGYLIPTMLDYDLFDLAVRCADWLASIQEPDGSYRGLDGVKRSFDTAAVIEGLGAIAFETGDDRYIVAHERALGWLYDQQLFAGPLRITPDEDVSHIYTMRASWILKDLVAAEYWSPDAGWDPRWGAEQRPHYIAYGLDGLDRMLADKTGVIRVLETAQHQPLIHGLMPFWSYGWERGEGTCTTSTLQFAILNRRHGLEYGHLIDAAEQMQAPNGGFYHDHRDKRRISWALKFYLDARHDEQYI